MTLDKFGRLSRANMGEGKEASAPPFMQGGCLNDCYMVGDAMSVIEGRNRDGVYKRVKGKSYVDTNEPVQRRIKVLPKNKKKNSKDRNSLLSCMADCFCPLYSIKRDFVDYMYAPSTAQGQGKKASENSVHGTNFAANVNMDSDSAYKGCYYFDNLAVDGQ